MSIFAWSVLPFSVAAWANLMLAASDLMPNKGQTPRTSAVAVVVARLAVLWLVAVVIWAMVKTRFGG